MKQDSLTNDEIALIDQHYTTNPRESPLIEIGKDDNKTLYQVIFDLSVESGQCTLVPIQELGDGNEIIKA